MNETAKHVGDMITGGILFATLAQVLPPLAALFSILYICLRIYWDIKDRREKRYADK
jgi:hypothetical protein